MDRSESTSALCCLSSLSVWLWSSSILTSFSFRYETSSIKSSFWVSNEVRFSSSYTHTEYIIRATQNTTRLSAALQVSQDQILGPCQAPLNIHTQPTLFLLPLCPPNVCFSAFLCLSANFSRTPALQSEVSAENGPNVPWYSSEKKEKADEKAGLSFLPSALNRGWCRISELGPRHWVD